MLMKIPSCQGENGDGDRKHVVKNSNILHPISKKLGGDGCEPCECGDFYDPCGGEFRLWREESIERELRGAKQNPSYVLSENPRVDFGLTNCREDPWNFAPDSHFRVNEA